MPYDWNPFKIDDGESIRHQERPRNFDQRNESYYLGKINEGGDSDSGCAISLMERPAAIIVKAKLFLRMKIK